MSHDYLAIFYVIVPVKASDAEEAEGVATLTFEKHAIDWDFNVEIIRLKDIKETK